MPRERRQINKYNHPLDWPEGRIFSVKSPVLNVYVHLYVGAKQTSNVNCRWSQKLIESRGVCPGGLGDIWCPLR